MTGSIDGFAGTSVVAGMDHGPRVGENPGVVVRQLRVRDGFILFAGFVAMQAVAAVAMVVVYGLVAGFAAAMHDHAGKLVRHGVVMPYARDGNLPPAFLVGLTFATYLASAL